MHSLPVLSLFVYGGLLILGGLIGFLKAKSKASLIAGSVSGLLACLLGGLASSGWPYAHHAGLVLALALFALMGKRFYFSKKFMPAGFTTVLSLVVAGIQAWAVLA